MYIVLYVEAKISQMTIQEIVDKMMEFPERTKLQILSPVVRGQKGTHKKLIENIKKRICKNKSKWRKLRSYR